MTIAIRVTRDFPQSAERVFDAWLDPATVGDWLFATEGGTMQRVEIDARVGGAFTVIERRPAGEADHFGRYLEIERPSRLVFGFGTDRNDPELTRVTVEVAPQGAGCRLTLSHEIADKWADYADRTRAGWTRILEGLAASRVMA